jgi:hypothetical protein
MVLDWQLKVKKKSRLFIRRPLLIYENLIYQTLIRKCLGQQGGTTTAS